MNKLRKQFEKETLKNVGKELKYDCEQCANEMLIEVWNDEYVFWLEKKLKKLNEESVSGDNSCDGCKYDMPNMTICYDCSRAESGYDHYEQE